MFKVGDLAIVKETNINIYLTKDQIFKIAEIPDNDTYAHCIGIINTEYNIRVSHKIDYIAYYYKEYFDLKKKLPINYKGGYDG